MTSLQCEKCGNNVSAEAPSGLCPNCLLRTAIEYGASHTLAPLLPKLRYFGDYELMEEIARGGMGVVYRAKQISLDRIVAVKMMRPGLLSTEPEIGRFLAEARTAASLQHPNIVAIHEVGEFDGLHYFSMDFVEGPSLADVVGEGALSSSEAARYVQAIAETVHYAHAQGVLHRDLKPSNVLVDAAGRPRITDFGVARRMNREATVTGPGSVMGTPAYMSPEQASGQNDSLTAASDVYSLGAILYELLTGVPPFRAASPLEVVRMVIENPPSPPRALKPDVDSRIETICLRCLQKEPAKRFQSAGELAGELYRFLRDEPIDSRISPKKPWLNRNPWVWVLILFLLLLSTLAYLVAWRTVSPSKPASKYADPVADIRPAVPAAKTAPDVAQPVNHTKAERAISAAPVGAPAASPVSPPVLIAASVSPDNGSGYSQVFTFHYAPAPEAGNAANFEVDIHDDLRHCNVIVEPSDGRVRLQFDPLRGPELRVSGNLGALDLVENSVCAVDLSGVSLTRQPGGTTLVLPLNFKPGFDGPKVIASRVSGKPASLSGNFVVGPKQ